MSAGRRGRALRFSASVALAGLVGLTGCATLGGNVKGNFTCTAPDGICAPSSSIDDRALAMISGDEAGSGASIPAGPYPAPRLRPGQSRIALSGSAPADPRLSGRTQERVLRIVFQPYIDERGRLHEASAVHAVVASGQWQQQAVAEATLLPFAGVGSSTYSSPSLAEAIDRADPPGTAVAAADPDLPDPAAVAAARARAPDPIAGIKADVAARLATPRRAWRRGGGGATRRTARAHLRPAAVATVQTVVPPADRTGSPGAPTRSTETKSPMLAAGAVPAGIKADPRLVARTSELAPTARREAGSATEPVGKPGSQPAMRAAAFPATVAEDN